MSKVRWLAAVAGAVLAVVAIHEFAYRQDHLSQPGPEAWIALVAAAGAVVAVLVESLARRFEEMQERWRGTATRAEVEALDERLAVFEAALIDLSIAALSVPKIRETYQALEELDDVSDCGEGSGPVPRDSE